MGGLQPCPGGENPVEVVHRVVESESSDINWTNSEDGFKDEHHQAEDDQPLTNPANSYHGRSTNPAVNIGEKGCPESKGKNWWEQ